MKYYLITGFIILAVSIITGRYLSDKGLKELDAYEKLILSETLSNYKMFSVFPPIILGILFVLSIKVIHFTLFFSLVLFLSLLMVYSIIFYILVYRKLIKNGFSKKYTRYFALSRCVSTAGFIAFFAVLVFGFVKNY